MTGKHHYCDSSDSSASRLRCYRFALLIQGADDTEEIGGGSAKGVSTIAGLGGLRMTSANELKLVRV